MARLTPLAFRVAHLLRRLYWRLLRPVTLGCRCVAIDGDRVLLVRHTYAHGWYLPGGGVKRGESLPDAARRETREETGVHVREMELLEVDLSTDEGKSDHVVVYLALRFEGEPRPDGKEIAEARFVPLFMLPEDTVPGSRRSIEAALARSSQGKAPA